MSLSDNLIPNESVLFEAQKHWVAPIRASLVTAPVAVAASSPDPAAVTGSPGAAAAIRKVGELRDQGLISNEEFDTKKRELLARI